MKTYSKVALIAACATAAVMSAQTLSGTVIADDTGLPIGGATVVAIRQTASPAQRPAIHKAVADVSGRYSMPVTAGQYKLCVHDAGVYLNPCQWNKATPAVSVGTATTANLRLNKGAWFIVRIHDTARLLPGAEAVRGSGVAAHLSAATFNEFPLPLIYQDDRIRDYGVVVPMNVAMRARIASPVLVLGLDAGKAPLSAEGVPFEVKPADLPDPSPPSSRLARMFPRAAAKILHVHATARK